MLAPMSARDDEQVTPSSRRLAETTNDSVVRINDLLQTLPGDDVAEHAAR
jgi:hypothetical protein